PQRPGSIVRAERAELAIPTRGDVLERMARRGVSALFARTRQASHTLLWSVAHLLSIDRIVDVFRPVYRCLHSLTELRTLPKIILAGQRVIVSCDLSSILLR